MPFLSSRPVTETPSGALPIDSIMVPPAFGLAGTADATAGKPEADAAPAKKRRAFSLGGFFGGKDTERAPLAAEKTGDAVEPPQPSRIQTSDHIEKDLAVFERETSAGHPVAPTILLPELIPFPMLGANPPEASPPKSVPVPPDSNNAESAASADELKSGSLAPDTAKPQPLTHAPARVTALIEKIRVTDPFLNKPQPMTPPTDTSPTTDTSRATAQLTLAFEITALQLTPSFKLGSVQLKALSDVVSLHLVAAQQAENPLAAGISFQIEHADLDDASRLKSLLLKPLGESRELAAPRSNMGVRSVEVFNGSEGAPISVTTSEQTSATVQLIGTFAIAAMEFTPAFEIGSLRLEPTSNTVLVRVAPSSSLTAQSLPPSFEIAQVNLGNGARIAGARVIPSTVSTQH